MSYAILRAKKLKSMGAIGGSLSHTFRTRDTANADPERSELNEFGDGDSPELIKAALEARLPEKRRSDAVLCVEYFIGASPEHFAQGDDGSAYFADAVEWLKARHGPENVLATAIHRDETSPHLVAYVVPLDDQGKLNAKSFLGGKAKLTAMQTDFAHEVGRKHGLERGMEGSRATHTTIREYYGMVGKAHGSMPSVDVPDPTLSERVNLKAYGNRVAEATIQQMAPEIRALRAKAAEAAEVKREAKSARSEALEATTKAERVIADAEAVAERKVAQARAEAANAREQLADQSKRLEPILKALGPLNASDRVVLADMVQKMSDRIQATRAAEALQKAPQAAVERPIKPAAPEQSPTPDKGMDR